MHSVRMTHPVHRTRLKSCGKMACGSLIEDYIILHKHKGAELRLQNQSRTDFVGLTPLKI